MLDYKIVKRISKNVYYFIDCFNRLIVFGKGNIPSYLPKEPQEIEMYDDSYLQRCYTHHYAPWSKDYITEVIICKGIKIIGAYAFSGMSSIHKVRIAGTVEFVGKGCFKECSLISEIILENDTIEIHPTALLGVGVEVLKFKKRDPGKLLFVESGLYNVEREELLIGADRDIVVIENRTEVINPYAFANHNKVKKIVCPDSLQTICKSAFEDCKALRKIENIPKDCVIGKHALRGTDQVVVSYQDEYIGKIKEERPKVAITEHGSLHLQNGKVKFYESEKDSNIDPTIFYGVDDLIDIKGGSDFIIGLRANGDVVYADDIRYENIFDEFTDSFSIDDYTGLGKCHKWKKVCQITAGSEVAAGLREDGTVYCTAAKNVNVTMEFLNDIVYIELTQNDQLYAVKENGEIVRMDFSECGEN